MATVERTALTWDYAPAPESRDAAPLKPRYDLFIGGKFVAPTDGTVVETKNPATEETLAEVAFAGPGDVAAAVEAARDATAGWAALPPLDRGKPIRESRDVDVPLAAAHFFSYAGWADKLEYAFAGRSFTPRGVVGQVVPWNFPLMMAAWKLAPALACGN